MDGVCNRKVALAGFQPIGQSTPEVLGRWWSPEGCESTGAGPGHMQAGRSPNQ